MIITQIIFDTHNLTYLPGQQINGTFSIYSKNQFNSKEILIEIIGQAKCQFSNLSHSNNKYSI